MSGTLLPFYVRKALEEHHLILAEPLYLLEWKGPGDYYDSDLPSQYESESYHPSQRGPRNHLWILYVGALSSFLLFGAFTVSAITKAHGTPITELGIRQDKGQYRD